MVLSDILPQTCIVAFDVPFANGLQNGVIFHVNLSWNNGFINGVLGLEETLRGIRAITST